MALVILVLCSKITSTWYKLVIFVPIFNGQTFSFFNMSKKYERSLNLLLKNNLKNSEKLKKNLNIVDAKA